MRSLVLNVAAGIGWLTWRVYVAVRGGHLAGEGIIICDGAAVRGVQGHSVVRVVVDAFDNVNFAAVGPVGTEHPECWPVSRQISANECSGYERKKVARRNLPCAANASRHVENIESKQAIIIGCIARDAHAVTAGPINNMGAVDTHVDKAVVGVNVTILGCCCLIDVVHVTSSGVDRLR